MMHTNVVQMAPTKTDLPPLSNLPYHVGIIMDGNGRWARRQGKSRHEGHKAGTENLRRIITASVEFGVKMLTIYAFSTENWQRPALEVQGLMMLLERVLDRELNELHQNGVQLRHLGDPSPLNPRIQKKITGAIELTKDNDQLILNIAFNYGGRYEIIQAIKAIIRDQISAEQVDEALLCRYLYTAAVPDPDLIIRTSGEFRTSNFLLWQAAYAEYYVTPTYWPDFDKAEYWRALCEYSRRDRRYGQAKGADSR